MRFSIAVEHPGEWRPTVYSNEEVFRILRFSAEKNGKLVIPCAFSGTFLLCCLPLRGLWKTCGSMCFLWKISSLLSSPKGARPVDEVCEI